MNQTPDIAYSIFVISLTLLGVFVAAVTITKKIYEWGKADGIAEGIVIGEANELRRRDEMAQRAREAAELQLLRDAMQENNQWELDA